MRDVKRRWRHGRKRGTARGVGVLGGPGFADDAQVLADLLGRHEEITDWMRTAGADLQVSAAGLEAVDALIDTWRDTPAVTPNLANRVGLFLGTVLMHEITGRPLAHLAQGTSRDPPDHRKGLRRHRASRDPSPHQSPPPHRHPRSSRSCERIGTLNERNRLSAVVQRRASATGGQQTFFEGHVHAFEVLGGVPAGQIRPAQPLWMMAAYVLALEPR